MDNALNSKEQKKKKGAFQRFILWVALPLLIILLLILVITSIAGINIFEKTKQSFSSFTDNSKLSIEEYQKRIVDLEGEIQEKNTKLERLQKKIEEKESEAERLLLENKRLENTIEEQIENKNDGNENRRGMKEITAVYETMAPKKAALIILEMKEADALNILSSLSPESMAKILEKMPPDRAAALSQKLTAVDNNERR